MPVDLPTRTGQTPGPAGPPGAAQCEGAGQNWTDQMRDALRGAAPNRYRDIQSVLDAANELAAAAARPNANLPEGARQDFSPRRALPPASGVPDQLKPVRQVEAGPTL